MCGGTSDQVSANPYDPISDAIDAEIAETRIHHLLTQLRDAVRKIEDIGSGKRDDIVVDSAYGSVALQRLGGVMFALEADLRPAVDALGESLETLGVA